MIQATRVLRFLLRDRNHSGTIGELSSLHSYEGDFRPFELLFAGSPNFSADSPRNN